MGEDNLLGCSETVSVSDTDALQLGPSNAIGEFSQKRFHVCDQADGLQRLMLDRSLYSRWIDIDTNGFHIWRKHARDGE
jgi:hypothetical protein